MKFPLGNACILTAYLLLILYARDGQCGHPCPASSLVQPCICTEIAVDQFLEAEIADLRTATHKNDSFITLVECNALKSFHTLQYIVSHGLSRMLLDKLVVSQLPTTDESDLHMSGGWLRDIRIRQFEVRDTELKGNFIGLKNPFEGEEHCLISFTAINCSLHGILTHDKPGTITTGGLNSLPKLESINFSQNRIIGIDKTAFQFPPPNLHEVNLSRNRIEDICDGAFANIVGLRSLDLSSNSLSNLSRSIFPSPAARLEVINLSWNHLEELSENLFDDMPALKAVNMAKNFLYSLAEKPWSIPWNQLTHVDLSGNFIECDCDGIWLLNATIKTTVKRSTPSPILLLQSPSIEKSRIGKHSPTTEKVHLGATCYYSENVGSKKYTFLNLDMYKTLKAIYSRCLEVDTISNIKSNHLITSTTFSSASFPFDLLLEEE